MDAGSSARVEEARVQTVSTDVDVKFRRLLDRLAPLVRDGLIVAFSGGVDSAFLLWAADRARQAHGGRVLALTAVSASMATVERDDARDFAMRLGVEHLWQESLEVSNPAYVANDGSRCYHCKSELFRIGGNVARERGYGALAYGYNFSDRGDTRPGHRAALENDVVSPLADAELTKDDIRVLLRAHGLPLADKPASPCLSSRLMTGVAVTPGKLADVEALEALLRTGGLRVFRVRLHEAGAQRFLRLEVAPDELSRALELREDLVREGIARGYRWVTLDLAGYRMGGGT
ncbi:ATP-utilizing enzymes of the PP-loop superfamily protein [Luteitalea pratensis]|uniref:ATP-utilizing enzymes of the PP-loop superfamily protein n=1 Tax=Luteitalea pratensis TaxID=1855912 RepID=A0A143PHN7_LUTPR|nr:ATP-dependent sacrificial sulfur transferase LarE [Luteitalea pratensis]AMY08067.1 ATP-utilizing enzymes of the PP-loop superfamily protein [Luteitalea pratensis]